MYKVGDIIQLNNVLYFVTIDYLTLPKDTTRFISIKFLNKYNFSFLDLYTDIFRE
jgi:hypothetical protein